MANPTLEFNVETLYRQRRERHYPYLAAFALAWLAINTASAAAVTPTNKVRFYTNMGTVEIELYGGAGYSPLNVTNFLKYVDDGCLQQFIRSSHTGFGPGAAAGL